MSNFDIIEDEEGKEYLIFDKSELYDDSIMGDKLKDFIKIKKLGEGSYGEVFKIRSKKNNKIYAMKSLDLKMLEKFGVIKSAKREIKIPEKLSHPHVIKIYKNFTEGNNLYIIYEFVANKDLDSFMKAHKAFNEHIQEEEIWNLFLQSMDALTYVHSKGVIHRDIKPANLLMDNNMTVKLGDFGVSAIIENKVNNKNSKENSDDNKTPFKNPEEDIKFHGSVINIGTNAYMPKDIPLKDYDQTYDVYSMGASFFELCYYHIPQFVHGTKNKDEIIYEYKKIEKEEDKNVHYSKELLDIINLMLEDKNVRKTSEEIFDIIKEEYSKKYVKNTSINSMVRCLYSFTPLRMYYLLKQIKEKPITETFIQCLKYISLNGLESDIITINDMKQILVSENSKLEGTKELDPRYAFAFLIKGLNKELNEKEELNLHKNKFLINAELNKEEKMIKFINNTSKKMNSFISKCFKGLIKRTLNCGECNLRTFKYINFFFININEEKILKIKKNINCIDIKKSLYALTETEFTSLYCKKCLNKTKHNISNYFYSLPSLLTISIHRNIINRKKIPIN